MTSVFWVFVAIACNAGAQVALKFGASDALHRWQAWFSPSILGGLLLYGISFMLTVRVYADFPLGVISPVMAGGIFMLITLASVLLFGEALTLGKIAGMGCIVVGILLLAKSA